jgi:hypothetical protein
LQYDLMLDLSFLSSNIAEYRQEVVQLHVRSVTGLKMIHSKHNQTPLTQQNPLEICSEEVLLRNATD